MKVESAFFALQLLLLSSGCRLYPLDVRSRVLVLQVDNCFNRYEVITGGILLQVRNQSPHLWIPCSLSILMSSKRFTKRLSV